MWTLKSSRNIDSFIQSEVESAFEKLLSRSDLGYFRADLLEETLSNVEEHSSFFSDKKNLAVIGVGGSSLGTKALCKALFPNQDKIKLLDNVDSHSIDHWLSTVNPEDWAWVMVSKSGGTMEVLSLYDYCHQWMKEKHGFSIISKTAVVTEDKESEVKNFATQNNLPCLDVPFDVGGRFSVFTPVGLFPFSMLDSDLKGFVKGHQQALAGLEMAKDLVAQIWNSHRNGEMVFYSFQYCDRLNSFGLWLQQLWSESLGKKQTRSGESAQQVATIVPCRGAADQHSVLQQVMEGPEKKFVCFHRVSSSEKGAASIEKSLFAKSPLQKGPVGKLLGVEAAATEQALNESQVGTMVLKTEDLNQESLCALMMAWMLAVGALGELLDIDAFNQPGVESGKVITRRVLSQVD